ncbi:MAG: hypothetical protein FD176_2013 [Rhodospirillaceae bacterium]|nr:MAG: hypothetical protein FD176_2013 [Rhodospirillaceae bacterium]TNC97055.1 MAG: hypothetical protein FD119_1147 [Stygiobacter sp.]
MDVAGAGMAQKQSDARTDALSADMKTLQERFDKLSDKLNDTQREVVQLRAELSGQGARLSDTNGRIGDVNIWLTIFAVIVALAAIFGLWQASRRAADEARHWLKKNGVDLLNELKDDLAKHKAATAKAAEDTQNHFATLVAGVIDKSKPLNEAEQAELRDAEVEVKDRPESRYTAQDWNIRAHAAYADKKLADAALYLGKVAESPDASAVDIALALHNTGVVLGEMGRFDEAVAVYDEVVRRFGAASEPAFRELVAEALGNRAWVSYQKGDDAALLADSERALKISPQAAVSLCNRAFALHLLGRSRAEVMAAYGLAWLAVNDKARWHDVAIKDLREHPRNRPGAEPVPADLIAAVAALAEKKE